MWTHIVAALLVTVQSIMWSKSQFDSGTSLSYPWYGGGIVVYFIASFVVMVISVVYHWSMCDTDEVFWFWLYLDQSSCLAVVVLGFFAGVPMGFHCFPRLRLFYIILCLAVCLIMVLLVAFLPKQRWDTIANVLITGSVVVYIVPAIHWLLICEKGRDAIGALFLSQLIFTAAAAVFYTQYIPECFAPGRFDRFGNSHQLWHIAIYISIAFFGECLVRVYGIVESGSFCD